MSSQPDPRHDALIEALRADRPVAGDALRARVAALGQAEAAARPARVSWWLRLPSRRAVLVAAPVVVAVAAAGIALDRLPSRGGGDEAAVLTTAPEKRAQPGAAASPETNAFGELDADSATGGRATAVPPSGRRLQSYRADLRVHVGSTDALSQQTTAAMRITRNLGGFVASAQFAQPGDGDGDSRLVVRVPVDKVSRAVMRFSGLGTVIGQDVSIQDLQRRFGRQTQRIEELQARVTGLQAELRRTDLTQPERILLRERIAAEQASLAAARGARQTTLRQGRLATVSLTLTTRESAELQPPPPPGRFEQTLRDAVTVLAALLTWLLAALIVAGPFVLLLAAAVALERRRRRRADERLLDATA